MNATLRYIAARLGEKSTWVALGSVLTGLGVMVKPEQWQAIMGLAMGISGMISIFLPATVQEAHVVPAQPHDDTTPLAQSMVDKGVTK